MLTSIQEWWQRGLGKTPASTEPKEKQCCGGGGCGSQNSAGGIGEKQLDRRKALGTLLKGGALTAVAAQQACSTQTDGTSFEASALKWQEYFKGNFRLMTDEDKQATVKRLERLAEIERGKNPSISAQGPLPGVLYGYAFNISKCQGYGDCVKACVEENNLDRNTGMQYIRIWEMKKGQMSLDSANGKVQHDVPVEGHFYMGTQCFHCDNPPCVSVCPVGATWKEADGIVVVDYDWCIGCRYCEAACPYWGRRFNWGSPEVPKDEVNETQHYLGNRPRKKGVMEKCTFCVQRTREGRQPACVEACPTGARVFGNLLDPQSEIRQVLATKKVFRLKEELGTEPKFWYYMD